MAWYTLLIIFIYDQRCTVEKSAKCLYVSGVRVVWCWESLWIISGNYSIILSVTSFILNPRQTMVIRGHYLICIIISLLSYYTKRLCISKHNVYIQAHALYDVYLTCALKRRVSSWFSSSFMPVFVNTCNLTTFVVRAAVSVILVVNSACRCEVGEFPCYVCKICA